MHFILFDYPNKLDKIFDKLNLFHIKPIIIGGYVRDKFLQIDSKDIDIELYGINSLQSLEKILQEFGTINNVGKSFGVCKLFFEGLDIDFSLPRRDSKVASGHKGFEITTDATLDFTTATSRRDFTINAIGYDVQEKKILDPFNGLTDLKSQILRAVNLSSFGEDPLRVLRAVQFSARFNFSLEKNLFLKCQELVLKGTLAELAPQRVFGEFEKLLLQAKKPSIGFLLLKELHIFHYFKELLQLTPQNFLALLDSIDRFKKTENSKRDMMLMLALICSFMPQEDTLTFLERLTNNKELTEKVKIYAKILRNIDLKEFTDYEVYSLATELNIEFFITILEAKFMENISLTRSLLSQAKFLGVQNSPLKPFIEGKTLIQFGLKPSKKFKVLLNKAYQAQIHKEFSNYKEALIWMKNYLL